MSIRPWWLLPPGRIHPGWWIALGALLLWIDHVAGLNADFLVLYVLPMILAAWYSGKSAAVGLAIAVPILRILTLTAAPDQPAAMTSAILATLFRGSVVLLIGLWFARLATFERELVHLETVRGRVRPRGVPVLRCGAPSRITGRAERTAVNH